MLGHGLGFSNLKHSRIQVVRVGQADMRNAVRRWPAWWLLLEAEFYTPLCTTFDTSSPAEKLTANRNHVHWWSEFEVLFRVNYAVQQYLLWNTGFFLQLDFHMEQTASE